MAPTLRFSIGTVSALPTRGCLCQQSNTGNSLVVIEGTVEVCRRQGHVSRVNIKDEPDLPYSSWLRPLRLSPWLLWALASLPVDNGQG